MERIDSGVEPDAAEAMEEAAVKIQAGVRGHLARKEVANRRLAAQAALQSSQAAPARFEATAVSNKAAKEDKKSTSPGTGVARGKGANAARAQRPTNAAQSTKFAKK